MPTSGDYIIYDDTGITNDFTTTWSYYTSDHTQQMWDEHQRECDRQDRIIEAQMQEEAERVEEIRRLQEEKKKYPLFFWRETCAERTLKEGIV